MIRSLIVAASAGDVIGAGGDLPWHLPADLRRFRALTTGHVVVVGRVTHESIVARLGRPLPGRTSVVVSRRPTVPARGEVPGGPPAAAPPVPGGSPVPTAPSATPGARPISNGCVVPVTSVAAGLATAADLTAAAGGGEFFVIGGVSVYQQALPSVDQILLTRVHLEVDGDRRMPPGWLAGFDLVAREDVTDAATGTRYSWLDYRRAPS